MYKISIIIPIYNAEKRLEHVFNSIINQTMPLKDIEVIMVNDGSTDASSQIIRKYCGDYDNFISVDLKENTGSPSKPRNIGIDNASSEYVMFLDADDTLDRRACETLYETMMGEDADLISGVISKQDKDKNYYIDVHNWLDLIDQSRDDDNARVKRVHDILHSKEFFKLKLNSIRDNPNCLRDYPFFTKLYKKSLLDEKNIRFPEDINGGEDSAFLFEYLVNSKGIVYMNRPVTYYHNTEDSLSKFYSLKTVINRLRAYSLMLECAIRNDVEKEFLRILLPAKLGYWINEHVFTANQLLNEDIIAILKDYRILFEKAYDANRGKSEFFYDIFRDIKLDDFKEALDKINGRRREDANFTASLIMQLDENDSLESQVDSILARDFDFEDVEIIFITPASDYKQAAESIGGKYPNVKFIPDGDDSSRIALENALSKNVMIINSADELNQSSEKLLKIIKKDNLDISCICNAGLNLNNKDACEIKPDQVHSITYNRDFLLKRDVEFEFGEKDFSIFTELLPQTCNCRIIDEEFLDELAGIYGNCKISVVMPVYNAEEYLKESINCVLNQTIKDIELICVDDGSSDSSWQILQEFQRNDRRVVCYQISHGGGGAARNFAVPKTKGKYIYFMDADDMIELTAFEELYDKAEQNNVDFVICTAIMYDNDTGEYFDNPFFNMPVIYNAVDDEVFHYRKLGNKVFNFSVTPWGKLYNRDFVIRSGAKFAEGVIFHDHHFFWEALFNSKRIIFYNRKLCIYRIHSKSSVESKDLRYLNFFEVYKGIFDIFLKYGKLSRYERTIYNIKVKRANVRYSMIDYEYKEVFYNAMKRDFGEMMNDERFKNFYDCLDVSQRIIIDSLFESENPMDFDLMKTNKYEMECLRLTNQNKRLKKKIRKLKRKNKKLMSSSSWRLTAPLRKIRNFRK